VVDADVFRAGQPVHNQIDGLSYLRQIWAAGRLARVEQGQSVAVQGLDVAYRATEDARPDAQPPHDLRVAPGYDIVTGRWRDKRAERGK